jgi:hypothetical protein
VQVRRTARRYAFFLAASAACLGGLGGSARAFFTASPQPTVPVVEYYNVYLNHYFLTATADEARAIEAGSAGPGWVRTGWSFDAYPPDPPRPYGPYYCPPTGCGKPVSRFYGTPGVGPNSHFYTADPSEAAGLEQPGSGWTFERVEFSIDVPDATGQCMTGQVPVYRLYNNRWMYNDSNHRYVTDAGERARMVARGWIDEGPRFCAYGAAQIPIKSFRVAIDLEHKILPSATCEDESVNRGPCMAVNNLPAPTTPYPITVPFTTPKAFFDRTGMDVPFDYVLGAPDPSTSPSHVFVQAPYGFAGQVLLGIHVDTRDRGSSAYSSINPLYQFHTTAAPGTFDDRFFPFGPSESDTQLDVHYTLNVKTIETRGEGSAAYGHPTLEFIDQRSGHHLYFTVLTYGTVAPADYLAPDVGTGKVIVGTTYRPDSPYITSLGLPTLPTPSGFVSPNFWGWGGYFEFRMDRAQFQRVIDAARTVDPALSSSPADYLVDNFHFNNEVYGDGEIGVNLADFTLELLRR